MTVHFFHGDKGGSGKSFAAMASVDWLVERRKRAPLVIDADMRNPDAHRMFETATRTALVNLRNHDGWIELASLLDEAAETETVVSLPGNIGDVLDSELPPFIEATKPLGVTIVLWWVINRTPDSVNLLRPALAVFGDGRSVVVRNLFFGDEPRFRRWNESKTRTEFLSAGGLEIDMPDLHERLADQTAMGLPAGRFSQLNGMRFGDCAEMRRWLDIVDRGFSQVADAIGEVTFEEAFLRLNGREPTGEEKRDALMIQDVARSAELHSVLLVFLALGKYETLYRQGAERIATAVDEAAFQAASIGERVGRQRAEHAAVEATIRKLAATSERQSSPASERTKQLAFATAIAVIVAGAVLLALAMGRIDGSAAAHMHLDAGQWLPTWRWVLLGTVLAEGTRLLARPLSTYKWARNG